MNKTLRIVLFSLLGLGVAVGLFLAGQAYSLSRAERGERSWSVSGAGPRAWVAPGTGPMMGGRSFGGRGTWSHPMMGGGGYGPGLGRDGGSFRRGPMMGGGFGLAPGLQAEVEPLTVDEARTAAQAYLTELDIDGLEIGEVMIFDNNAYVVVKETATGLGAFELLVDPVSKVAYPEHGANMMWNLKYGALNHRQMMGRAWQGSDGVPADVSAEMQLTESDAREAAQAFLDQSVPGAQVAEHGVAFYGYYTFDYEVDGTPAGMLSVNGESGGVLLHGWHSTFIEEAE